MKFLEIMGVAVTDVPEGCNPCRFCGGYCMEADVVEVDWDGRGRVIRINSLCDESGHEEKDDLRTEFEPPAEAVIAWNKMNTPIAGQLNSGEVFRLETKHTLRTFRHVGIILCVAGLRDPVILADALTGLPTLSHQDNIIVQCLFTGQFMFLECSAAITRISEDDE